MTKTMSCFAGDIGLLRRVFTVFLPFAGGYFLSYLFRSTNAIIAPQLAAEVGLGPADLGLVTAAYALAFAAFQIPLGILLDRFGPRRVQSALLLAAAAGAVVFSLAETREGLIAGRAMIGLGVAGGLMASLKAITLWFPQERWPLVNGCFLAMGGLGAVAATAPLEWALAFADWRSIFAGLAVATLAVSAIIFLTVPERSATGSPERMRALLHGLRAVYASRLFWRYAPICIASMATNMAIQTLWAGPWFRDVAGFDRDATARALALLALVMTAGFVTTGLVPDMLRRIGIGAGTVLGGGIAVSIAAQAMIVANVDAQAYWPWVIFGLTMNTGVLGYAVLSAAFPLGHAGRVNTALNLLVFAGFFAMQWGMGAIVGLWAEVANGGYPPVAYRAAFGAALGFQILAFLWYLSGTARSKDNAS